jgi:Lar family restriction alleviation protein
VGKEADCPFCGSKEVIIDTFNYASGKPHQYRALCQDCGTTSRWCDTEEEAWTAWNRRPTQALPPVFFGKDLFFFKGAVYARNPQNGFCFISNKEGYKRIKKPDYLLAYADCAKAAGIKT